MNIKFDIESCEISEYIRCKRDVFKLIHSYSIIEDEIKYVFKFEQVFRHFKILLERKQAHSKNLYR